MKLKVILLVLGIILLALGNACAIIYGIYLWGSVGLALSASLWGAAKLWLWIVGSGLIVFFTSLFMND